MNSLIRFIICLLIVSLASVSLSAQNYKALKLRKAVESTGLKVIADSLMPDTTILLKAKDGREICLRTDPMGNVEHIGIPIFHELMRIIQPSPVYDFLEYAVLNWKYKIDANQLYLSKVIFKYGGWDTLLNEHIKECECSIENLEDKLYVVTWKREDKEIAIVGIPVDYELLNNDTRRNMEKAFIENLKSCIPPMTRPAAAEVSEDELSIYGTEGLFVIPGKSYIIDLLNQNIYYKLTTIYETTDTIIYKKKVRMQIEAIQPVVVCDSEFPAETFANLMMVDDISMPDATMELDFHLSNYHHEIVIIPLSQLKAFCRQQGCNLYFAYNGVIGEKAKGMMIISNLTKGYNHLFSLHTTTKQLTTTNPTVQADVYLYIPPISKEKFFGTASTKKSGIKFNLP